MPLGGHLLADILAQGSVDRLVRLAGRFEGEWQLLRSATEDDGADDAAHQGEELDFAREQQLQGIRITARELVVLGMDRGFDAAIGLRPHRIPHRDEILVQRCRPPFGCGTARACSRPPAPA